MPTYRQEHSLPYSTLQLFALVADVKRYPEFIPWVVAARVLEEHTAEGGAETMLAELKIRFGAIATAYTSTVTLNRPKDGDSPGMIDVRLVEGPFKYLSNRWEFEPVDTGGSLIRFEIDFAFQSRMFEKMVGGMFEKAVKKMIGAFEARAHQLYG